MAQNTLHKQTAKFASTILNNLPEINGNSMQYYIENPKLVELALRRGLPNMIDSDFGSLPCTVWREALTGWAMDDALDLLKDAIRITPTDRSIMGMYDGGHNPKAKSVRLIKLSYTDLGFTDPVTLEQIMVRAHSFGLANCPVEAVCHVAYSIEPDEGEFIYFPFWDRFSEAACTKYCKLSDRSLHVEVHEKMIEERFSSVAQFVFYLPEIG